MRKIKRVSLYLLFLFSLPIIVGQLPFPNNTLTKEEPEKKMVAYAAPAFEVNTATTLSPFHVLMLFTHSHESYKPVVESRDGLQAVYDDQTNIYNMQELIGHYLQLNGLDSSVLGVDVMDEMKQKGATFNKAYKVVRPHLQQELAANNYQLVIDFHRDAVGKKITTLETGGETYAKIAFVVGAEHPGYEWNLAYAEALHATLNGMLPGISRGVMKKEGAGVDGVYNQDLSPVMLLIELGGIDNTEQELQRTMALLAQAIAKTFGSQQL